MEDPGNSAKKRRGLVAAILSAAVVAVALPVSGALAGGGPSSGNTQTQTQDQGTPRNDSPRDRGDCPEKHGRGGSDSGDSNSGDSNSDTSAEL
jgi:hypothetical protein